MNLVNDNYEHHVGDLVLAKVAKVLRTSMRAKDIVGRWGGDEFVAIVQCGENFQSWLDMIKKADRLMYEDKKKKAL